VHYVPWPYPGFHHVDGKGCARKQQVLAGHTVPNSKMAFCPESPGLILTFGLSGLVAACPRNQPFRAQLPKAIGRVSGSSKRPETVSRVLGGSRLLYEVIPPSTYLENCGVI